MSENGLTIHHIDGKKTEIYSEVSVRQQEEVKRQNEESGKRGAALVKESNAKKEAREAALPTPEQRMEFQCAGLTNKLTRMRRSGDGKKAARIEKYATAAATALDDYRKKLGRLKQRSKKSALTEAVEGAVAELRKVLPACFPSDDDARVFARRNLPMLDAVRADMAQADKYAKLDRAAHNAKKTFEDAMSTAAYLIYNDSDIETGIRRLQELGQ